MKRTSLRAYRLGVDLGANSLGWFVVWLDDHGQPEGLGPGGVRIFPDGRNPQSKQSNAAGRRLARSARRRRDRYLQRRGKLMGLLVKHGLMPADEPARKRLECLDPYGLRAKALDEVLPLHHVGRALFHLNQRRGLFANRAIEQGDKDASAIKAAAGRLQTSMQACGARTLGEFLNRRHQLRATVRARSPVGGDVQARYEFYPTRAMVDVEFEAIWAAQAPQHPTMTAEAHDTIREAIFSQRAMKRPSIGKCSLDPATSQDDVDGFRCAWSHPLALRFRIWQDVRNLAVVETGPTSSRLGKEDQDKVARALLQTDQLSFDEIRRLLGLPSDARFNLESDRRDHLKGDATGAILSARRHFGPAWHDRSLDRQIDIVALLESALDEAAIIASLGTTHSLDEAAAQRALSALLPDGYCRLGLRAIKRVLPLMEAGRTYAEAASAAGYDHALLPGGKLSPTGYLPYYGQWLQNDVVGSDDERDTNERRWGRLPNPTVHIGIGQLRRVVNELIRWHGPPAEITVELTRDLKLSPRRLAELEREQAENQRKNDKRTSLLRKLGLPASTHNLLKLRLWDEQGDVASECPYTGEAIGLERLVSDDVDIDHLIPFSISWDDSAANKVVCMRYANREKGNRTPFEAFGHRQGRPYDWADIAERAARLPRGKRWRFGPGARAQFEELGDFQARLLNETSWLARVAKQYLAAVTHPHRIHVLPGRLTALLRATWELNDLLPGSDDRAAKSRKDHRHHAIDALVAALTDQALLRRMANAHDDTRRKIEVLLPWPTFRIDLETRLKAMLVSHKPDHGLQARLHEDTAYGTVEHPETEDGAKLVYRKTFVDISEKEIDRIRDRRLRDLVRAHVAGERQQGKTLKAAVLSFAQRRDIAGHPNGIRHVRLTKSIKPDYLVPIRDKAGRIYKSYNAGENAFVDILQAESGRWIARATTVFQANQANESHDAPAAQPIMRVFKGDMLRIDHAGAEKFVKIVRLSPSNNLLYLVEHHQAGVFQTRHDDPEDSFRWLFASFDKLREWNAELVRIDTLGQPWRRKRGLETGSEDATRIGWTRPKKWP